MRCNSDSQKAYPLFTPDLPLSTSLAGDILCLAVVGELQATLTGHLRCILLGT